MTNPIGVQDAIDLLRESEYFKQVDVDKSQFNFAQERWIYMDFIRNYGQLSSGDPIRENSGANRVEVKNFELFKENVGYDLKQTGRQRDDKQTFQFYPIKHLNKNGKPQTVEHRVRVSDITTTTTYDLYMNNVPTIPITDENDAERRAFTPLKDDYIFIVYPRITTLRGVKPFDYMRFPTPSCPPCLETILPDGYEPGDVVEESDIPTINITRPEFDTVMPILHRPIYQRDNEGQTLKDSSGEPILDDRGYILDYDPDKMDYDGNTYWRGEYNWENYTFWQITRILDVPAGFQAFFTRGLSIIY